MSKGGQTTATVPRMNPADQAYIRRMREHAMGAGQALAGPLTTGPLTQTPEQMAAAFMNPFEQQVIGGMRGQFDAARARALADARMQATLAGAFGGSRDDVFAATRLGELDRTEASQIGDLLFRGYDQAMTRGLEFAEHQRRLEQERMQEPMMRHRFQQEAMQQGMGPMLPETHVQQRQRPNWLGTALGIAQIAAPILFPGAGLGISAALGATQQMTQARAAGAGQRLAAGSMTPAQWRMQQRQQPVRPMATSVRPLFQR